jgi:hypothetical protein
MAAMSADRPGQQHFGRDRPSSSRAMISPSDGITSLHEGLSVAAI